MPLFIRTLQIFSLLTLTGLICAAPGWSANLMPLGVQDAQLLRENQAEIRFGMSYTEDVTNLFRPQQDRSVAETPSLTMNIGLGNRVEGQIGYSLLVVDTSSSDSDLGSGDMTLGVKIRFLEEQMSLPALALRITTKLPLADDKKDFGTNQADILIDTLATRNYQSFSLYGNLGIAILGDPTGSQDEKLRYALGIRYPLQPGAVDLLAAVEGMDLGSSLNDRGAAVAGVQFHFGNSTLDFGGSLGYRSRSEDWSLRAGLSSRFDLGPGW